MVTAGMQAQEPPAEKEGEVDVDRLILLALLLQVRLGHEKWLDQVRTKLEEVW
jgi:hypothetical protein